jgi:sugar phosphate isomerase/epimerase
MFEVENLSRAIDYARKLEVQLEIYPMWHEQAFVRFIKKRRSDLRGITSTFHEPYPACDHSFKRGTNEHENAVYLCRKTYETAANIGAKHMIFHHVNRSYPRSERLEIIKIANENLHEMNEIAAEYGISNLVENVGVVPLLDNMLFYEDEFIALFDEINNDCLLDIGHVHCNGWDISHVVSALSNRIKAYHVHNNNMTRDTHQRICDGTFDINVFVQHCREFTPEAQIIMEYAPGLGITLEDLRVDMEVLK